MTNDEARVEDRHLNASPARTLSRPRGILPLANHEYDKLEALEFETEIASDTAPLHELVNAMIDAKVDLHVLRDPTRGGVTSALGEIAQTAKVGMLLEEASIPISEEVKGACEILGLDPLYVANEGKLLATVAEDNCQLNLEPNCQLVRAYDHSLN